MKQLRFEVGGVAFFVLALHGLALWALPILRGAEPFVVTPLSLLAVLGFPLLAAFGIQRLLDPLSRDFARLRAYTASEPADAPEAEPPTPESDAMASLFEAVGMLRARSVELESLEREARRSVEDAERMRVSFVATMGHDLRGPLNAIVGFADLLVMEGVDAVEAGQRQSVAMIRRSAQDLLFLLDQILDWARFEAGRITLSPGHIDLPKLLVEVAESAEARSADRGMRVRVRVSDGLPELRADEQRLAQALYGLLDPATRAAEGPEVELRARREDRITGPDGPEPPRVRITVRDPHLIIRQADQETFFEAFRPSFAPGGKRIAGLGLGPALARVLIRAHGGDVWFESRADSGTTFTVSMPTATP